MFALETRGLRFTYPGNPWALMDISIGIRPGEFAAVLGANGSGKTTLFRLFSGMLNPTGGGLWVNGLEVTRANMPAIYRVLGFVFQDPNDQLFAPTVMDDVSFGPRNLGLRQDEVRNRVQEALNQVGLEGLNDRPVHALSFGQKRRAAIAGVLAMRPQVIILDEPTSGLDPRGEIELMDLLHHLNHDERITVVMASHDVDLMAVFADRGYVLYEGSVLASGPLPELFSDAELVGRAGLRLPYVAQLVMLFGGDLGIYPAGPPLTVAAARGWLHEHVVSNARTAHGSHER